MATRLLLVIVAIIGATAQQQSKSTDDFSAFSASLGGMDYVWILYAIIALLLSLCCIVRCGICNSWCREEKYDALSEQCYTEIIASRGYDASKTGLGDKRPLSLLVLRQDLKEKQVWHNDWKRDFIVFLRNEHALFSTCYSHPDHPFSRRDRRCILISVILMDFAIAMGITYMFTFVTFDDVSSFILDYVISYIFGIIMSILESILVTFAVCAAAEKCPTCIRTLCNCCGSMVLFAAFMWALAGFIGAVIFMALSANEDNAATFWEIFALNFVVGLVQAWFLIDLIKMILQFRTSWKAAHPPPPGPEREEQEKKKRSCSYKCLKCGFIVICCPIWLLWQCCCSKRKKLDPYDDGQDDFGVNYKEYIAWKNKEEIGDRALPKSYQMVSTVDFERAVNKKVDNVKQGVTTTYEKNMAGIQKTGDDIKQKKDEIKQKGKMFGNKFKQKAIGMQMKLNKKNNNNAQAVQNDNNEDVELVVGQNNNNQIR